MPTGEVAPQQAFKVTGGDADFKPEVATPPSLSPVNPAPCDKVTYDGIEVLNRIVWKGWEQGKEFTKNLVLKNLGVKTQKLKYKVPHTRFFSTMYPKPIFLSAGSSFTLPVTFRPLEEVAYNDKIVFMSKDVEFEVPLSAVLPATDISIPIDLDFKMCAVKDHFSISFDVFNTGDLDTPLQWEVNAPFTVEPAEAVLKHKSSVKFRATFRPEAACVYEASVVCNFGPELSMSRVTTFYGIGKFPHLLVSSSGGKPSRANQDKLNDVETEINFGTVAVAASSGQWVELHNLSPVRTPFRVERVMGMSRMDTVFQCTQTQGVVPPMSLLRIPFTFTPHSVDTRSVDYFSVVSVGDISRSVIRCVGASIGPMVELGSYSVNFMQVDLGGAGTRTLDIINNSDVDAVYQFDLDCAESVFKLECTSGVLKANSRQTILMKFVPQHPINYYRRVPCLVHNQQPLFVDFIGTCHTETVKPAVLRAEHVSRYITHVERGLSFIAPEALNELLKEGRLEVDSSGCLATINADDKAGLALNPSLREIAPTDEFFNDGVHTDTVNVVPHVSADEAVVDFGNCQNFRMTEEKTVNITNHTRGKVTVQWMGGEGHVFSVFPCTQDIPPMKACSFRVTFKPSAPNQLYGNELECYVSYKSMRDYRLVEELTQTPPWCLTIKCMGHTFMPSNETFLPRVNIAPPVVVFPAVNKGEAAYRTVVMGNSGETPILYNLEESMKMQMVRSKCGTKDVPKQIFSVKPSKGILPKGYKVFTFRMLPTEVNAFSHDAVFRLNDNKKYDQMIHLCGSAEMAAVLLDNEGCLYFKPTCVGTRSSRTYGFKNVSRIPLRFQWHLNYEDAKVLNVEPDHGVIQPNQTLTQTWLFSPKEESKHVMKPSLVAWGQGLSATSSGGKKKQFVVRAIGQGCFGDLRTDQSYVDFGFIVVGTSSARRLTIYNDSSCSLHYRLLVEPTQEEGGGPDIQDMWNDRPGVEFDKAEGVIPARSKQAIIATVRPVRRIAYQYTVSYQLITPDCPHSARGPGTPTTPDARAGDGRLPYHGRHRHPVDSSGTAGPTAPGVQEPQHLTHLLVTGVYPTMAVTDIRSQGSAVGISKKALWNLFSLDNLNAYLDSDPSADELRYNIATRHSTRKRPTIYTKAILDFNFSAAPLGSDPCSISLMLENPGTVPCDWAFMFPRDIQMEMGFWTESGDCGQDELHVMKVMDNKLFTVTHKRGNLKPGQSITVTLSYLHTMAGTDRLPVLLKLARGREILLNFVGVTVEIERPYIHFPSNKHVFNPVPVGEKISPTQVYELYNGGAVPVLYECDLTPLDIIRQENFDQAIFECLNPCGEILPGLSVSIEWRFFPLEAKTYMVDIPIRVHNGDMAIVTFTGIGYDKRIMGETMPFSDQPDMCGVPSVQSAEIPGQLGYLSMERISFGNMPLFSQARRMVFVTNKSKDRNIFFEWHVTSQTDTKFLNIYPVRGEIGPNDYKMCRVTFQASGQPSFFDLDLVCEISDMLEYGKYKEQLSAWDKEKERQRNEFTITEDDLHADERLYKGVDVTDPTTSGRVSKLDALADGRPISADGELTRYKTLPPIRILNADEKRVAARRRRHKMAELWQKPEAPKPFLLHLGITARTHDTRHFQVNFPDEYYHFYIDRTLSNRQQQQQKEVRFIPPSIIECSLGESNIIASVLGNCLRGLLDDTYFLKAVQKVMQEPIPYFKQFADKRVTTPMSSTPRDGLDAEESGVVAAAIGQVELLSTLDDEGFDPMSTSTNGVELDAEGDGTIVLPESERSTMHESISLPISPLVDRRQSEEERVKHLTESSKLKEKQTIKKLPEFGNTVEQTLENTVLNLMYEALSSEYSIVSKPRFIAMPRRRPSANSKKSLVP